MKTIFEGLKTDFAPLHPKTIKNRLKAAACLLRAGKSIPEELANDLANSLEQIACGKDPKKAFFPNSSKGRPPALTEVETEHVALELDTASEGRHYSDSKDGNKEGLYTRLGREYNVSPKTIQAIDARLQKERAIQEEIKREAEDETQATG